MKESAIRKQDYLSKDDSNVTPLRADSIYRKFTNEEMPNNVIDFPLPHHSEDGGNNLETYSSTDSNQGFSPNWESFKPTIKDRSIKATKVIRTFYTDKILFSLEWLEQNHESDVDSIPYMQQVFNYLKAYFENYINDPFSSFLSALFDALAFNDSWISLKKEQFSELKKIITMLNNQKSLTYDEVDKKIHLLEEKLGLDTTPF